MNPIRTTAALALCGLAPLVAHAQKSAWTASGSLRVRQEAWDWFRPADATKEHRYHYTGAILRYGADGRLSPRDTVKLELAAPLLLNLPTRAGAAAPQGALGLGAVYRANNGSQQGSVFPKQVYLQRALGKTRWARVGRFEFNEGAETVPADPGLAAVKASQVAQRLLGAFAWTHIGRSVDGVHVSASAPGRNLTVAAGMPTEGVFDLDGANTLTRVRFAYVAVTHPRPRGESRFFFVDYEDTRPNLARTDNTEAAQKDRRPIRLATVGGHWLRAVPRKDGVVDALAWGALQAGKWGGKDDAAWAYTAQLGWRPKSGKAVGLSYRLGYFFASGDSNPSDSKHTTFYPLLNTPRLSARTPFFAEANLKDAFVSVSFKAAKRWSVRADAHALALASKADLWYQAGGPFNSTAFGLVGRPSSGHGALANLIDVSIDGPIDGKTSVGVYFGQMLGQGVVRSIYAGKSGSLGYVEVTRKL